MRHIRIAAQLADTCVDMGFTHFTLGYNGPDWDVTTAADWLAWRDEHNAT